MWHVVLCMIDVLGGGRGDGGVVQGRMCAHISFVLWMYFVDALSTVASRHDSRIVNVMTVTGEWR